MGTKKEDFLLGGPLLVWVVKGLFFVDDFNHLAVGFEAEVLAFGFFAPEEESGFAGDVDFVGHFAFEVEDVK